jgi:hypothetical protein
MPAYGTAAIPLSPGDQGTAFSAESLVTGTASVTFYLGEPKTNGPKTVSVEILFSGAPGTFQLDVQSADTDTATAYQNVASATVTAVDTNNRARVELYPFVGKYLRIMPTDDPSNVVTATIKVTRP